MTVEITPATYADVPALVSLLRRSGLPTDGLTDHLATALVGREGTSIVASAALELHGDAVLLRSVAVDASVRGHGLGQRITRAALDLAHRRGARAVYLLTTTAGDFFARHFGFRRGARAEVPVSVQQSVEFTTACPATAEVMVRRTADVVFACVQSAGRSQMAAAFFNALADPTKAHAIAAGTRPGDRVHPEVVEAMREVGIDLRDAHPRRLTDELAAGAQVLVTMGCGEECPVGGARREDWPLADPHGRSMAEVRAVRDAVRERVRQLVVAERWLR